MKQTELSSILNERIASFEDHYNISDLTTEHLRISGLTLYEVERLAIGIDLTEVKRGTREHVRDYKRMIKLINEGLTFDYEVLLNRLNSEWEQDYEEYFGDYKLLLKGY